MNTTPFYKSKSGLFLVSMLIIVLFFVITLFFSHNDNADYIYINNCQFKVEIADTQQERFLGLGNQDELCEDCGMLFKFPEKGEYSFCMRDMKFPLDFIWILDYNIVSIIKDVPYNLKSDINPHISADKVLELNAGTAEKCGIKKGDKISH